jgi:hypothetical protein
MRENSEKKDRWIELSLIIRWLTIYDNSNNFKYDDREQSE